MTWRMISLAEPMLGRAEAEALVEVIDSGWLTMGERVAEFERRFARMHGREEAVAVSSCTAALHLALAALDLGPGDEVLVPSMTFVATANAVRYVGATPVFVDIESVTEPLIALADAERKLSPRTRAVIAVHYGGFSVDMAAWRDFADSHGLFLVEDAAHAPESAGADGLADASAYSFFSNKNMTTAEGGMLLMRDADRLNRARRMRSHGMTTVTLDRHKGHAWSYDVVELGYNYRLDELRAAVGLVQLERLPAWNEKRRALSQYYRRLLQGKLPLPFAEREEGDFHLMPVLLPEQVERQSVMGRMRDAGIQTSIHYPPVHLFTAFRGAGDERLPVTEAYGQRVLTLPLHPGLEKEDVECVVEALLAAIGGEQA